jgi:hypothetical protein
MDKVEGEFLIELRVQSSPGQFLERAGELIHTAGAPKQQRIAIHLDVGHRDIDDDRGDVVANERGKNEGFRAEPGKEPHMGPDSLSFGERGSADLYHWLIEPVESDVERDILPNISRRIHAPAESGVEHGIAEAHIAISIDEKAVGHIGRKDVLTNFSREERVDAHNHYQPAILNERPKVGKAGIISSSLYVKRSVCMIRGQC